MDERSEGRDKLQNQVNKQFTVILAGGTGDLGRRIAGYLLQQGTSVKALVRKQSSQEGVAKLHNVGATVQEVDFNNVHDLAKACEGGACVVSAVSGLGDVIIGLQARLMEAAVIAGVPRFIPSDYCIDYTKLKKGTNRNLDFRREFNKQLNKASIKATSILNGMFSDLLTGEAPLILFKLKRVIYWGRAEQLLDFTTIDNTAAFTAAAAIDPATPRYLRIAGDVVSSKGLREAASAAFSQKFRLARVGGPGLLAAMINITRTLAPQKTEVFPPWQGMQYLHNMYSGLPKLQPLDNHRYPGIRWTSVREVLTAHAKQKL